MKKRFLSIAIILIILMAACAASEPAPLPTTIPTDVPPTAAPSPSPEPAEAQPERDAAITAVSNQAQARATIDDEFVDAQEGMIVLVGGSVQTFEDSRASLNLRPEGTIIRVGPNSIFTMQTLTEEDEPVSRIKLDIGQIWILLNGGSMEVETPSGVASVRGSLLSVSYNPELERMEAFCLEGQCSLKNDLGKVELTDGYKCFIEGKDSPWGAEPMDEFELQEWINENPDAWQYFDREEIPEWLPKPDFFWLNETGDYFGWVFDEENNPLLDEFLEEHNLEEFNPEDPFWGLPPEGDGTLLEDGFPINGDGILDGDGLLDGDGPLGGDGDGVLDGDGLLDGGGLLP